MFEHVQLSAYLLTYRANMTSQINRDEGTALLQLKQSCIATCSVANAYYILLKKQNKLF